ncbi:MAG: glycosyltransferase family A protein [Chloroflexota bacterium]|nr:glycosyltransferase family A protein [Chloroflexota bacterium]
MIIPLMAIPPYDTQVSECIDKLERQTAVNEVIVSQQKPAKLINKNRLLNRGLKKAVGNIIWHCDADFLATDDTLLERMEQKLESGCEAVYPMFHSAVYDAPKIADGGLFTYKEHLERYGPLDETLLGIGYVTFPLLNWVMCNLKWYCGTEFMVELNTKPFVKRSKKGHLKTRHQLRSLFQKVKKELEEIKAWPRKS